MTDRLYYQDAYLREFRARVVDRAEEGRRIYLDRTAFYPTSGGQPFDTGLLDGVDVVEVADEDGRIAHVLAEPLAGEEVAGEIDWHRRYDHMQQHTGQHLLSAVLEELFHFPTLSFHMSPESSSIEIGAPAISASQVERVEERCAELAAEARPVAIGFEEEAQGLRKASERSGTLRIISIRDFDRSACGGTHVRTTAETAPVLIRKLDKVRGNVRLEFVCGLRALRQARSDFRALAEIARLLSAPMEQAAGLIAAQIERIKSVEKLNQRLSVELAQREGRERWAAAEPDDRGIRTAVERGPVDEAARVRAQAFVAGGKAVFAVLCENPPSLLLACSADAGVHAGEKVKTAVTSVGGRGGGNAALAQGSAPVGTDLEALLHTALSR